MRVETFTYIPQSHHSPVTAAPGNSFGYRATQKQPAALTPPEGFTAMTILRVAFHYLRFFLPRHHPRAQWICECEWFIKILSIKMSSIATFELIRFLSFSHSSVAMEEKIWYLRIEKDKPLVALIRTVQ